MEGARLSTARAHWRVLGCAVLLLLGATTAQAQSDFIRGDANGDADVNIADVVYILEHLFNMGPSICIDAIDVNDDGLANIADSISLLDVLFGGMGATIPAPNPACGSDPTADALDCVGPTSCPSGCTDNGDCPMDEYCSKALGDCAGIGECEEIPLLCTAIFDPVCGCDGLSYGNACNAAAFGVSIAAQGQCPTPSCTENTDCPSGQYCAKALGDCNGTGDCEDIPFICILIYDPVCGCDGNTYGNSCQAAAASVSIDFTGPCP